MKIAGRWIAIALSLAVVMTVLGTPSSRHKHKRARTAEGTYVATR